MDRAPVNLRLPARAGAWRGSCEGWQCAQTEYDPPTPSAPIQWESERERGDREERWKKADKCFFLNVGQSLYSTHYVACNIFWIVVHYNKWRNSHTAMDHWGCTLHCSDLFHDLHTIQMILFASLSLETPSLYNIGSFMKRQFLYLLWWYLFFKKATWSEASSVNGEVIASSSH